MGINYCTICGSGEHSAAAQLCIELFRQVILIKVGGADGRS